MTETKTVLEYGNRLIKMLQFFDKENIVYRVGVNRSGVDVVSVVYENAEQKRKADSYETDLLVQEKTKYKKFENIKQLRLATPFNQAEFGRYFNVANRTVQAWEYGTRECRDYIIDLMAYKLRKEGYIE